MSKRKSVRPGGTVANAPTQPEIAQRAHERFVERGCEHGHSVEDWLHAERELMVGREQRPGAKKLPLGLRILG